MTTIGISTLKERQQSLHEVLKRLGPQADQIFVYLGYNDVPSFTFPNVEYIPMNAVGESDFGDAGKFYMADQIKIGYYLTCDDDLFYPDDYVEFMIAGCKRHGDAAAVALHGWDARPAQKSYHKDRAAFYHYSRHQAEDIPAHILGTLGMCYPAALLPDLNMAVFERPNMCDLWFAMHCNERNIPRIVLAHEKGYLPNSDLYDMGKSIWAHHTNDLERERFQTETLNGVDWNKGDLLMAA